MNIPEPGPNVPRRGSALRAALGRAMLRVFGWRIGSGPPDVAKCVVIAAPHSSNRDFFVGIAIVFALRLDAHWIGKAELFRGPLGPVMRWLGGLAVDRRHAEGVVEATVAMFKGRDRLMLAVAPEGTRKPVSRWKSGFYRIALGAGVPIVPGYFDNGRRLVGFGDPFHPTGNAEADIAALRGFYAKIPRRDGLRASLEPVPPVPASEAEDRS
jgi:1-acyl-sn-glycerol-3-phosphate acyltransferase